MSKLIHDAYGKSKVRLTKVTRNGNRHIIKEMSVDIQLEGDFARCYTHGDNGPILPTDTMKNTVYALARNHPLESIESFAKSLSDHFLKTVDHCTAAKIDIREVPWKRMTVNGAEHDHSFIGGSSERRTTTVLQTGKSTSIESGIDNMLVLKTTKSGFVGYIRDKFTTLRETTDRIFATSVQATWKYNSADADWNTCFDAIRNAMIGVFAEHDSLAVQQTLYAMGEAALDACKQISQISLTMPNQHRLLINLEPFGMDNPNEIFVPTDEPHGLICGTISRG
jgi:urate oxidase